MALGLRAKLEGIGGTKHTEKVQPERPHGTAMYSYNLIADERLSYLDPQALRRIGWTGNLFDIEKVLFLDTETTGLSGGAGTVAFLVGIGYVRSETFFVEQYLMRDYSDEPEMLRRIAERAQGYEVICTFNGNSFDLPLLETRFTMCRMRDEWPDMISLDLLAPTRRTWKLRLGSCKLSRIEEYILGQPREDDLPGSEVPQRYFSFLKSGDMELLEDIVEHNRQDIITLGILLAHLTELYTNPEQETHAADLFSMALALEKQGESGIARELYAKAAVPARGGTLEALRDSGIAQDAMWHAFLLARRNGNAEEMRTLLERMEARGQMRDRVYIELSKLYEHRLKNYTEALRYAELAQTYVPDEEQEALRHRLRRIRQKTEDNTTQRLPGMGTPRGRKV